jgi:hypothetical protein
MKKIFFGAAFLSSVFFVYCSSNCDQPLRDAFNFYIVDGSGQDIFVLDPSLNKDSVYLAVVKGGVEQPATRSIFTRDVVGADTFNVFYNSNIPDLNINSDTQAIFLYTPHNRKDALLVITYNEVDNKCGSILRVSEVRKGVSAVQKTSGYYKIVF